MRPVGSAEELERRRRRAVQALKQGIPATTVAVSAGASRSSVYRWKEAARVGSSGLKPKHHPGRHPKLTGDQIEELKVVLTQNPRTVGWPYDFWTCPRIAELIEQKFHVRYHPDHVRKILHKRAGFSCQKPERRARERNQVEIKRFVTRRLPQLLRYARERKATVMFVDESGFLTQPTVRRTWAPRGHTPILSQQGSRDKVSVIGGLLITACRGICRMMGLVLPVNDNVRGTDTVKFLRHVKQSYPGPLLVLWDSSNTHDRSRAVRDYLDKHRDVHTGTLPTYAPELNPQEQTWGHAKDHELANYAPFNVHELRVAVTEALGSLAKNARLLKSFLRHAGVIFPVPSMSRLMHRLQ